MKGDAQPATALLYSLCGKMEGHQAPSTGDGAGGHWDPGFFVLPWIPLPAWKVKNITFSCGEKEKRNVSPVP